MNKQLLKVISIGVSLTGIAVSLLSDWVSDKQLEQKIDEMIPKIIEQKQKEEAL